MLDNHQNVKFVLEIFVYFLRIVYKSLFITTHISKNRIFFMTYGNDYSKSYLCSPKYITEYLIRDNRFKNTEIIWLCKNKKDKNYLIKHGIKTVSKSSLFKYVKCLLTSSVIIDNTMPPHFYSRRTGQLYIETWHGGGCYKLSGIDLKYQNPLTRLALLHSSNQISHFISSSSFFSQNVIKISYGYKGEILEIGLPRNDYLFKKTNIKENICKIYNISSDSKLILYAPTFRDNSKTINKPEDINLNYKELINVLSEKYGGKWVVLVRSHGKQKASNASYTIDVSDYPDTQELLAATDFLISDYSSIIWDYSITNKPCILFCPDLKEYINTRSFYIHIKDWGFPVAETNEDIHRFVQIFDICDYKNKMKQHKEKLGSFESGRACRIVSDLIYNHINSNI